MAIMIPVECNLTRRPMSERIVFEAIKKNLSDEWHVFHSFDYVTCHEPGGASADHDPQIENENHRTGAWPYGENTGRSVSGRKR